LRPILRSILHNCSIRVTDCSIRIFQSFAAWRQNHLGAPAPLPPRLCNVTYLWGSNPHQGIVTKLNIEVYSTTDKPPLNGIALTVYWIYIKYGASCRIELYKSSLVNWIGVNEYLILRRIFCITTISHWSLHENYWQVLCMPVKWHWIAGQKWQLLFSSVLSILNIFLDKLFQP